MDDISSVAMKGAGMEKSETGQANSALTPHHESGHHDRSEADEREREFMSRLVLLPNLIQAAAVVADLGVVDFMHKRAGDGVTTVSAEEVAEALGLHVPSLFRVMRAACGLDVLSMDAHTQKFRLMPRGQFLRKDHPDSIHYQLIIAVNSTYSFTRSHLRDGVESGKNTFLLCHDGKNIWEYWDDKPGERMLFNSFMLESSRTYHELIREIYVLDDVKVLIDVGGCMGDVLSRILARHPKIETGILFDLPEVIEAAKMSLDSERVQKPGHDGNGDSDSEIPNGKKMKLVAGDMFRPETIPDGADAVLMGRILHDWNDEDSVKILRSIRSKLPIPGGKLFLSEMVLYSSGFESGGIQHEAALWCDVEMLILTKQGKERTEEDWRRLLRMGGFELLKITNPPARGTLSVLYATVIND